MFKRLFLGLFVMFFATPAMAQLTAQEFAGRLQPMVGKPLGDTNITVFAVRAEGNVAILTLNSPDWQNERANVTEVFTRTFCGDDENSPFFSKMQMRIDTLLNGKDLVTGEVVEKCPPAQ